MNHVARRQRDNRLPSYFYTDPDRAERWLMGRINRTWRQKRMDAYKQKLAETAANLEWLIKITQAGTERVTLELALERVVKLEDRLAKMTPEEMRAIVA